MGKQHIERVTASVGSLVIIGDERDGAWLWPLWLWPFPATIDWREAFAIAPGSLGIVLSTSEASASLGCVEDIIEDMMLVVSDRRIGWTTDVRCVVSCNAEGT